MDYLLGNQLCPELLLLLLLLLLLVFLLFKKG